MGSAHVNRALAAHRTRTWNDLANAGTFVADTLGIATMAALATVVLIRCEPGAGPRWSSTDSRSSWPPSSPSTTPSPRPHVAHVGSTPSTFSFPSGHTAATFVIYGGIAMAVSHRFRSRALLVTLWTVAVTLTAWVGASRIYEGEHHPTDVLAGLLLGVAAFGAAVVTIRRAERSAPRPSMTASRLQTHSGRGDPSVASSPGPIWPRPPAAAAGQWS